MKLVKSAFIASVLAGVLGLAQADDKQVIQSQLNKVIPNAPEAQIVPSVVDGLYEVSVGPMVIYMSADGKYAFNGSLINLNTRENLTEKAKAEARTTAMSQIDESTMIVYPGKGDGKRFISVFTDIDCPYCHKMHSEIPALNEAGITVRYLAYPRSGVNSPSYYKAVSAWCADDPAKAMDAAMSGQGVDKKQCKNPVAEHMQHAQFFGVNGTPNIILDDGQMVPGYIPAAELIQAMK